MICMCFVCTRLLRSSWLTATRMSSCAGCVRAWTMWSGTHQIRLTRNTYTLTFREDETQTKGKHCSLPPIQSHETLHVPSWIRLLRV